MNQRFGHRINILGRLLSKTLNEMIAHTGLTNSQWPIIVRLLLHVELTQAELCEQLSIEASTVSKTLQRMEQMGWILRQDGVDKREKKVRLTEKANRYLSIWFEETYALENMVLKGIPTEDITVFDRVLDQMIENIRNGGSKSCGR
jgi:MarR family transcriptional regulator, transcriptional regulator for hemolysin